MRVNGARKHAGLMLSGGHYAGLDGKEFQAAAIHALVILCVLCAVGGSRAKTLCHCRPVVIIIASLKEPLYVGDCMKAAK